jgi:DNA-binding CsgD family transcriptional regulator
MDAGGFQEAWTEGRALNLESAVAEALLPVKTIPVGGNRPFDLTDREMEVLELLAEGKSDREIGDLLFISTRTAQTLGKLDVSSRSAATTLAIREGLAKV